MTKLSWTVKTKLGTKSIAEYIRSVASFIQALFVVLLITYSLLLLIEYLWGKSVSPYLSLNLLLIEVTVTGVISILTSHDVKPVVRSHSGIKGTIFIITMGLVGAGVIWYKTEELGWLSYVISFVSGSLIVILLAFLWQGEGEGEIERENSQDN